MYDYLFGVWLFAVIFGPLISAALITVFIQPRSLSGVRSICLMSSAFLFICFSGFVATYAWSEKWIEAEIETMIPTFTIFGIIVMSFIGWFFGEAINIATDNRFSRPRNKVGRKTEDAITAWDPRHNQPNLPC